MYLYFVPARTQYKYTTYLLINQNLFKTFFLKLRITHIRLSYFRAFCSFRFSMFDNDENQREDKDDLKDQLRPTTAEGIPYLVNYCRRAYPEDLLSPRPVKDVVK